MSRGSFMDGPRRHPRTVPVSRSYGKTSMPVLVPAMRGDNYQLRHPQHQIGQPVGGVERRRSTWRPPPCAASRAGSAASAAISAASRSGREIGLIEADRAARLHQHAGVGALVLVERMRQRHQDAGPADRGKLGHGRGAGARHDQMARRHARRQIGEERRDLGRDLQPARRSRARAPGPPRAPAARSCSRIRRRGSSRSIAGGTMSAMTRAPWLPPNTRRLQRPVGSSGG